MQVDHGGLEPPTVNPSHDPNNKTTSASRSTHVECYDDYDEILRQFRESLRKIDELMQERPVVPWKPLKLPPSYMKFAPTFPDENTDSILDSTTCCIRNSETETQQKPFAGAKTSSTKEPPSSTDKSRLIGSSTKFPDPKNCRIFLQPITRENAPCWFHRESRRVASTTMTQQETIEGGPSRPHRFHPGASLPTTQFSALTHGATCSAEHYHAFRRPPPARDKNQARRVPEKQATHKNKYFKISSKLTRGATLRKEHYQAFRKPPPTRDRKQDWIMKRHE
jgi:hypothetical protein